ncbi:hypothetical protein COJ50_24705 [Bacillus cereus]|uniref:Uncharacterized protein n=1 Tax=Bacillus cereus TaxID=1396 RepID=A0A2B1K503_BACCE|nr:hypothetical protein COJ50_24705 [Bacillus cereus]
MIASQTQEQTESVFENYERDLYELLICILQYTLNINVCEVYYVYFKMKLNNKKSSFFKTSTVF